MTDDPSPKDLREIYLQLLEQGAAVTRSSNTENSGSPLKQPPFSYNLALTDRAMVICPRLLEGLQIKDSNGDLLGPISLNGTILGGTLLVKSEQEWETLRNDEEKLKDILQAIGLPSVVNVEFGKL